MTDILNESRNIFNQSFEMFNPSLVLLAISGGDDSLTALSVARYLGIKIDFAIHINTRTGIQQTSDFVVEHCKRYNIPLIIGDAGNAYEDYVIRKGFFGKGRKAHSFSYHLLKAGIFRKQVSKLRKRRRNFRTLVLNGVRVDESKNRTDNFGDVTYRIDNKKKNMKPHHSFDVWVNIIHWWSKNKCLQFLKEQNIERNPVSIKLNRSGECLCGTMQSQAVRNEVGHHYPD